MSGLKFLDESQTRVGGYLVRWGSPAEKDLQGEYFTPKTDLALDWYPQRPILYHHGLDGAVKSEVVGVIDTLKTDDAGVWAEGQLNTSNRYWQAIRGLIAKGVLSWSSGSLPHLVETAADGFIKRWPLVEGSMTPTPAEPRQTDITMLKAAYKSLGLDVSHLKLEGNEAGGASEGQTAEGANDTGHAGDETSAGATSSESQADSQEQPPTSPEPQTSSDTEDDPLEDTDEQPQTEATQDTPDGDTADNRSLSLMEQLQAIINAVLQVLGYTEVTDEQRQAVIEDVSKMLEDRVGSPPEAISAGNIKAAFADAVFQGKVNEAIKSRMAGAINPSDIANQFAGYSTAGQGGASRLPGGTAHTKPQGTTTKPAPVSVTSKYERAGLSVEDLAYWYTVNSMVSKHERVDFPAEAYREMVVRADDAVKSGKIRIDYENDPHGVRAMKTAEAISKRAAAVKLDELTHTGNTGYGAEWVPELWATQLWMNERESLVVSQQFQTVDMPSDPFNMPIEGVSPEMELAPETEDADQLVLTDAATSSVQKIATGKLQLTTNKFMLRIGISAEQEEDSIISTISEARRITLRVFDETRDNVILNADSSAVGNVNLHDATPPATKPYMTTAGAGLIKTAFNLGTVFDAGGVPTLALMRKLRFEGLALEYRKQMSNLVYIVDSATEGRLLGIPEFLTLDKIGSQATVLTGMIGMIDGIPVVTSGELAQSDTNGKVSNTPANNTKGRALLVYRPWHKIGYRRQPRITSEFYQMMDAHMMVISARMGQKQREGNYVAMLRNIAV